MRASHVVLVMVVLAMVHLAAPTSLNNVCHALEAGNWTGEWTRGNDRQPCMCAWFNQSTYTTIVGQTAHLFAPLRLLACGSEGEERCGSMGITINITGSCMARSLEFSDPDGWMRMTGDVSATALSLSGISNGVDDWHVNLVLVN
jgi:hypothetical protein